MVAPGQFLERSVIVRSGALALDGLSHRGTLSPPCLLLAPHPALGGNMQASVLAELAWALSQAGFPTLRFDYRGVGASQGQSRHAVARTAAEMQGLGPEELADEVADARAACAQLLESTREEAVCAVGYSFGAAVALQLLDDPRVAQAVLIAPPTRLFDFAALAAAQKPVLLVLAQTDALCDRAALQKLADAHQPALAVEVIPRADHAFNQGLSELGRTVAARLLGPRAPRPPADDGERGSSPEAPVELELPEGDGEPLELED